MAATSGPSAIDLALTVPPSRAVGDRRDAAHTEVLRLFDDCRDGVYRYALSFGLAPSDAEDVVQEVFLALFRHLARHKNNPSLRGWLFRVTRNLALKRRTGERRIARLRAVWPVGHERIDPSEDPEEHLVSCQRQTRLRAVVHALPERDRACLRLRAEGLRYRDIASALGVSLGTVARSLARTIVKIDRADPGRL